jgi:5-methylcytosine-specific restriction endonuclease McrA
MSRVLVLTSAFTPHKVVTWEHAIGMIYGDPPSAEAIESTDEIIHPSGVRMPAVVRLTKQIEGMKRAVKFSRVNVFTRDGFKCCYCGSPKRAKELNYDHVRPRHLGGRTTWENIVSSCYRCNSRKAHRTPEEAGMKLLRKPHKPKSLPMTVPRFDPKDIPPQWTEYVRAYFVDDAVA